MNPPRRNFTLYFIIGLGLIVLATFVAFTLIARDSVAQRRVQVARNLHEMGKALASGAKLDPALLLHPSWPEQAGYMIVDGVRLNGPDADGSDTIWIFENVPPQKLKVGRQVLFKNGSVEFVTDDPQFQQRLKAQEDAWKKAGRTWSVTPLTP